MTTAEAPRTAMTDQADVAGVSFGSALVRCVGDVDAFLQQYWGKRPFLRQVGVRDAFADVFALADVDRLIASASLRSPAFRMVKAGETIDVRAYTRYGTVGPEGVWDVADAGRIYAHFDAGATLVLQGLQTFWLPLTTFCRDLELSFTHPVQTNAYITPPESQGLGVHYDSHDVFVVQVSGRKQWEVYRRLVENPLHTQPTPSFDSPGPALISAELQPGDCLYIPRGYLHEAYSRDETSAHLTIGILSHTWRDVLQAVFDRTVDEVEFRESVPIGFARDTDAFAAALGERVQALKAWLDTVDVEQVGRRFARDFWVSCTPILAGQLQQLALVDAVDDRTVVRRRPGCVCELELSPGATELTLLLADRELRLPAETEPAIRMLINACGTVATLAEYLDDASRLVLVRRLIREGVLEIVA